MRARAARSASSRPPRRAHRRRTAARTPGSGRHRAGRPAVHHDRARPAARRCPRPRARRSGWPRTPRRPARPTSRSAAGRAQRPPLRRRITAPPPVEIGREVAAHDVVDDRGVEDDAAQRPNRAQGEPQVLVRPAARPTALRLEAEQPAAGGRNADRAGRRRPPSRGRGPGPRRRRSRYRRCEPPGERLRIPGVAGEPDVRPTRCRARRRSAPASCVLPRTTAPAARRRRTTSAVGGRRGCGSAPRPP